MIISDYSTVNYNTVVAVGSFDGLHRGHMSLIEAAQRYAEGNNLKTLVYTFKQHPFFALNKDIKLITDNLKRAELLFDVDYLMLEDFKRIKDISAKSFVSDILVSKLKAKAVVCGENNRFGKDGQGDIELLKRLGSQFDFSVLTADTVIVDGIKCSSTNIREALSNGKVELANKLLGRKFSISGRVEHGKQLGRKIGFATANFIPDSKQLVPRYGVYASDCTACGKKYKAITNVGLNPTFKEDYARIETHILDFDEDIYGKTITVEFLQYMRESVEFESVEQLKNQLAKDKKYRKEVEL